MRTTPVGDSARAFFPYTRPPSYGRAFPIGTRWTRGLGMRSRQPAAPAESFCLPTDGMHAVQHRPSE